ncbi:MAG: hypothetical protein VYA30_01070, partial [Myxococcota bacterium]|nr:hypothetical protein [Myxococcota bacterium]
MRKEQGNLAQQPTPYPIGMASYFVLLWVCIATPSFAESLRPPPPGSQAIPIIDTVRAKDTKETITQRTGCEWTRLVQFNRWPASVRLKTGMAVRVPRDCRPPKTRPKKYRFEPCQWQGEEVDHASLKSVLDRLGFEPPAHFRAHIDKTTLGPQKQNI